MITGKHYKYFSILFLLTVAACEKFDYTANDNSKQYINSYTELEQTVTGAYAKFASIFSNREYWWFRNGYLIQGQLSDDYDCYTEYSIEYYGGGDYFQTTDENQDTVYLYQNCYRNISGENNTYWDEFYHEFMNYTYKDFYKAIRSQNFILVQADNISDPAYASLLGEVYFLRAYSYYRLTRLFGNIPLIIDTDVDYQVNRASFEEIYGQIESDLLMAIQLLPPNSSTARMPYITPNRGSAKALLAEVYLTMGGYPVHDPSKYALAAQYAREVIDSASYLGFGLVDDFVNLYDWHYGLHQEMVSTVNYKAFDYDATFNSEYGFIGFNSNELTNGIIETWAEMKFYNRYPPCYRKEVVYEQTPHTIMRWDPEISNYIVDMGYPVQTTTCYMIPLHSSQRYNYEEYRNNIEEYYVYILRYAHTLLTYAEASARSGQLNDLSYECVNQIRRRARNLNIYSPSEYDLLPGLSVGAFADSVVWERAWEFTGEAEGRWFDLLRLEMVDDLDELRDPHEAPPPYEGISEGQYFFPIPEEDIFLNPNLEN